MIFQIAATPGFLQTLLDYGLLDAVLPFLLIFAIVFGILQQIKIFRLDSDKPNKAINGTLAMLIAAMVVGPHVLGLWPPGADPVLMIMDILPEATVLLVAIFLVVLLLGLSGGAMPSAMTWIVGLVALALLAFTIIMAILPGFFFPALEFLRDPGVQAAIIIILIVGLVIFFVFREPEEQTTHKSLKEKLEGLLGPIK